VLLFRLPDAVDLTPETGLIWWMCPGCQNPWDTLPLQQSPLTCSLAVPEVAGLSNHYDYVDHRLSYNMHMNRSSAENKIDTSSGFYLDPHSDPEECPFTVGYTTGRSCPGQVCWPSSRLAVTQVKPNTGG
jgi:hypothetical protein